MLYLEEWKREETKPYYLKSWHRGQPHGEEGSFTENVRKLRVPGNMFLGSGCIERKDGREKGI